MWQSVLQALHWITSWFNRLKMLNIASSTWRNTDMAVLVSWFWMKCSRLITGSWWTRKYQNRIHASFQCPDNASRLFDLITVYDQQFLPAFYFALQDTLVTASLDIVLLLSFCDIGFSIGVCEEYGVVPCGHPYRTDHWEIRNHVRRWSLSTSWIDEVKELLFKPSYIDGWRSDRGDGERIG